MCSSKVLLWVVPKYIMLCKYRIVMLSLSTFFSNPLDETIQKFFRYPYLFTTLNNIKIYDDLQEIRLKLGQNVESRIIFNTNPNGLTFVSLSPICAMSERRDDLRII